MELPTTSFWPMANGYRIRPRSAEPRLMTLNVISNPQFQKSIEPKDTV